LVSSRLKYIAAKDESTAPSGASGEDPLDAAEPESFPENASESSHSSAGANANSGVSVGFWGG